VDRDAVAALHAEIQQLRTRLARAERELRQVRAAARWLATMCTLTHDHCTQRMQHHQPRAAYAWHKGQAQAMRLVLAWLEQSGLLT